MSKMISIILSIVIIVFIVCFAIGFVELSIPIIIKADFDRICDSYVEIASTKGGLKNSQKNKLILELESLNPNIKINSTNISKVGTIPYKGNIIFKVNATYSCSTMINVLVRKLKNYSFNFNKICINNKLVE